MDSFSFKKRDVELDPEEQLLFDGYPKKYGFYFYILLICIFGIFVSGQSFIANLAYAVFLTCIYIYFFRFRLIITNQKVVKYYPFGIYMEEVKKADLKEQPYLITPKPYFRITRLKMWPKADAQIDEIRNKCSIGFETHGTEKIDVLNFNIFIENFGKEDHAAALKILEEHWQLNPNAYVPRKIVFAEQKRSKAKIFLIALSVISMVGFAFLPLKGLHFGVVHDDLFIAFLIGSTLLAFGLIHIERKPGAFRACISYGLLLAMAVDFSARDANRWLSEVQPDKAELNRVTLVMANKYIQIWALPEDIAEASGRDVIPVVSLWKGFNPNVAEGQTMFIPIHKGALNDYWVPVDAFKQK